MKEIVEKLKYSKEIKDLISKGIDLPKELIIPQNTEAYRWVSDSEILTNHLPVYLKQPQRFIQEKEKNNLSTAGYALSCFNNEFDAENVFRKYLKTSPNFWKLVGNSISKGIIKEFDGRITKVSSSGHFSLYEFIECNLNDTFAVTRKLV